ncbi:MAG TPA: MotA/TolQ/ExbB proton channel family protein [Bacillota bacterium]|nr:MotA/TolQ/ExbB proton channel family protein [Bacillota bacterium]HOL10830.1 MotA/TolQ/ExbB proton channel family protein [Bacillota bacterium]HPO98672.1 MotA/TolQ/ExbB proton channel family protein [Bacillota bacterium]
MQLIEQGGFFMLPLLLCSILMVAIIGERYCCYRKILKQPLQSYDEPRQIVKQLRQWLTPLHTIITIAPMLGLLGTVTGLMKCFNLLGDKVVGNYNPQLISRGISEALLTTAVGLIITVIATIFYNYFNARLQDYVAEYNSEANG